MPDHEVVGFPALVSKLLLLRECATVCPASFFVASGVEHAQHNKNHFRFCALLFTNLRSAEWIRSEYAEYYYSTIYEAVFVSRFTTRKTRGDSLPEIFGATARYKRL
jgi:hypothetical protein